MKPNIILLYGGDSVEHEISIITALQLKQNYVGKYNLILCYLKNGKFYFSDKLNQLKNYKHLNIKPVRFIENQKYIKVNHKKLYFEAIWLVSHGKNCEDGTITSFFKVLNIPIIALNTLSAAIGQNKYLTKLVSNVDSLPSIIITKDDFKYNKNYLLTKANELTYPIILKPNSLGSSVGVSVIYNNIDLITNIEKLLILDDTLIMEKCLEHFIELNVAVVKNKDELIVSEIEKVSNSKVLTYKDKYVNKDKSLNSQNKEIPANIDESLRESLIRTAKTIYKNMNLSLVVRMDFLYDTDTNTLYFNELNNIPGSLAFYLFNQMGISTTTLIDMCIDEGLKDIEQNNSIISTYDKNILSEEIFDNVKFCK